MIKYRFIIFIIFISASMHGQINKIINHDSNLLYMFGTQVSISNNIALVERRRNPNHDSLNRIPKYYVLKKTGKNWKEIQNFQNKNFLHSGNGISIYNNKFAIRTACKVGDTLDYVLIYELNNAGKFTPADTIYKEHESIKLPTIYKDWILYRTQSKETSEKFINTYIFYHYENNHWVRKNQFESINYGLSNPESYRFSIRDKFAVVGEPNNSVDSGKNNGRVIIFRLVDDRWQLFQTVYQPDPYSSNSYFGLNVSISPDNKFIAIFGGRDSTYKGNGHDKTHIYIYRYVNDEFEYFQKINGFESDSITINVGYSFDFSNEILLVSDKYFNYESSKEGIVVGYKYNGEKWVIHNKIYPPSSDTLYYGFGSDLQADGERVIVGAPHYGTVLENYSGAAYIFQIPARDTLWAEICQGQSYTFNDTVIYDEGHYTDTLLASYGVDSVVQLYLTVHPEARVEIDTVLCEKGDMLQVGDSILTEAGVYEIGLKDIFGCDSIVTVHLDYESLEVVDSITADYGCENGKIDLILQNANNPPYAFSWSGGETTEEISGLSSGVYSVKITDKSGCIYEKEYNVDDSIAYLIPNAFFPSGQEELNKTFRIYQAKDVDILSTEIYDRWGEKVFNGGQNEYWDGTYQGKMQSPGVYLYRIVIDSPCGEEVKTGQVMLLR